MPTQVDTSDYLALGKSPIHGQSDGFFYERATGDIVLVSEGTVVQRWAATTGTVTDASWGVSGDITISDAGVAAIGTEKVLPAMLGKPRFRCVEETVTAASLTDGTAAVGTKTLTATIPAGALYLYTTIDTIVGFTGDVSAVIQVGDGTDADRYNTGTPDIFSTAAAGVSMGAASGTAFHATAKAVVVTVTSAADITPVIAGAGSCHLKFWFLEPV